MSTEKKSTINFKIFCYNKIKILGSTMLFRVAKGLEGDPELAGGIMFKDLAWSRLGIPPAKLPLAAGDRDTWRSQLELLLPQPQKDNTLN